MHRVKYFVCAWVVIAQDHCKGLNYEVREHKIAGCVGRSESSTELKHLYTQG